MTWRALIFLLLLLCGPCLGADICIRDGGSGDGSAWNNALDDLPSTLTRGNTYWVADGTYASYTFDDAESGTTLITCKKATVAAHGPTTGWLDAYGDGTATWSGSVRIARDYILFDGVTRNESDWSQQVYGFRVLGSLSSWPNNFPPGGDHFTFRYVDVGGTVGTAPGDPGFVDDECLYFVHNTGGSVVSDATVSHCFFHNNPIAQLNRVDGITIEYCHFEDMYEKECIRGAGKAKNGVIKYNKFKNTTRFNTENGTGIIAIWDDNGEGSGAFDNWDIYGNVMWDTISINHTGGAIVVGGNGGSFVGVSSSNVKIYNNTIVGLVGTGGADITIHGGTGNEIRNTIWLSCLSTPAASPNTSNNSEEASDPFVDSGGDDFRLNAPLAGASLSSPYNIDLLGNTRGGDGTFDRGAYEFGGAPPATSKITATTINAATVNGGTP